MPQPPAQNEAAGSLGGRLPKTR